MCTLTVLPGEWLADVSGSTSIRVVFSRDERRQRAGAWPVASSRVGGRRVLMPIDSDGGGTWIAANDAGLVFALLNVTRHVSAGAVSTAPAWTGRRTRGAIIPSLVGCADLDAVAAACAALDPARYAPFDLLCISTAGRLEVRSDGSRLGLVRRVPTAAWMRTSSSLGDCRVIGPRRRLFEAWFRHPPFDRTTQDEFHRHYWAADREVSVLMERPDARTVSITTVECGPGRVRMEYSVV